MKYTKDEIYPNIAFKIWTEIVKYDAGWSWNIFLHIEGPDDVFSKKCDIRFISKEEATKSLLSLFKNETIKLIERLR